MARRMAHVGLGALGGRAATALAGLAGLAGLVGLGALGCAAPRAAAPIGLGVVVDGGAVDVAAVRVEGFALRAVALPAAEPPAADPAPAAIAAARAAYLDRGDFDACLAALAPIEVPPLLARERRDLAARVLVWRAACSFGRMARAETAGFAAQLAGFGLELPPDAGAVTPDVEALLIAATDRAGAARRVAVEVTGRTGARLAVDGRPAECALPCTVEVVPGDHVLAASADGAAPAWRLVRAPAAAPVALALPPASPALAAAQWRARTARGLPPDDDAGLALVARAAAERRVVYLAAGPRLRGALIVDGAVRARGERAAAEADALVRDLTLRGGLVERVALWRRPRFWLAVGAAAAVAAAVTAALVLEPDPRTEVGF